MSRTIKDWWDLYYDQTKKVSDITRNLAYSGLAIIWIFRISGTNNVPRALWISLITFALALCFDVIQYMISSFKLRNELKRKESEMDESDIKKEFGLPKGFYNLSMQFFKLKILMVAIGYFLLFYFLIREIF